MKNPFVTSLAILVMLAGLASPATASVEYFIPNGIMNWDTETLTVYTTGSTITQTGGSSGSFLGDFSLSTSGMTPTLGPGNTSIYFFGAGGTFNIYNHDTPGDELMGTIDSLGIVDIPNGGYTGSGTLNVTGGDAESEFGDVGPLTQLGFSFTVPNFDFSIPHTGVFVNTTLTGANNPGSNSGIPEPASLWTWIGLSLVGALGRGRRTRRSKTSIC